MAAKITSLTSEQSARLPEFRDRWTAIGLSTERADRPRAEAGVRLAYQAAGLEPPSLIIWLDSPTAGAIGAAILSGTAKAGQSVWASVRASVWASVWASVGASVRASVGESVGASVRESVRESVGASVWASVGESVGDQTWRAIYGQHDANWLGFYEFFSEACGVESADRLRGLSEVAQSAGWWWAFEGAVILTERPLVLTRDTEGRLHNEVGPALLYPDGTGVWAWHGTRLPQHWVEERETLDPTEVLRAENVEQRAAGSALLGWPRMAAKLDRKIIDGDPESDLGALVELTMPGLSRPGRFLQARCPRNGIICEGVPYVSDIDGLPIETALAAQAWRIGDPLSDYVHPPART